MRSVLAGFKSLLAGFKSLLVGFKNLLILENDLHIVDVVACEPEIVAHCFLADTLHFVYLLQLQRRGV